MNSLLLAIAVALGTWLLFKSMRYIKGKTTGKLSQQAIPRIGTPGTITEGQIEALTKNHFTPSRDWSFEEAALILDATAYLRTVYLDTTGEDDPPITIQNQLLQFILQDEDLRNHVRQWGITHRQSLDREEAVPIPPDPSRERVARYIAETLSKTAGTPPLKNS